MPLRSLLVAVCALAAAAAPPPVLPAAVSAPSAECDLCLLVVGAAAAAGEANATTVAEVLAALDDVCVAVAGNASALCELFVNVTVDGLLPFLDKQLNTLAWPIAQGVCSLFVPVCFNPCCDADYAPEQLRLALTGDATEMRVSWVTLTDGSAEPGSAGVRWAPAAEHAATGLLPLFQPVESVRNYTFGNWLGFISTATMTGLAPGAAYTYTVGTASAQSSAATFRTLAAGAGSAATPLRMVQIGDMGYGPNSNITVATVAAMVAAGDVDLVIHVGDGACARGARARGRGGRGSGCAGLAARACVGSTLLMPAANRSVVRRRLHGALGPLRAQDRAHRQRCSVHGGARK